MQYLSRTLPDEILPFELGWIVAFLEGEGWFGLRRKEDGRASPVITASQKDLEPLHHLKRLLGGAIYRYDRRNKVSVWTATGLLAQHVMQLVQPYMSRRRQKQMEAALAYPVRGIGRPTGARDKQPRKRG